MDIKSIYINTHSGIEFHVFDPKPEQIVIEDIAHALSHICRFGGHCNTFYSVASHSIAMTQLVSPENALCALLHDASEAFCGDCLTPIKKQLDLFRHVEDEIHKAIAKKFRTPFPMPSEIKEAEKVLFDIEWSYFMSRNPKPEYEEFYKLFFADKSPMEVKHDFINMFSKLTFNYNTIGTL